MRIRKSYFILWSILFIVTIQAQPFQMQVKPAQNTQIYLKYFSPSFQDPMGMTTFSGAYELTLNTPIHDKLNFFATLPFGYYKIEDPWVEDGEVVMNDFKTDGIGNILLGVQWRKMHSENKQSTVSLGLGLQTADSQELSFFSLLTRFYSNVLYSYDYFPVYTNYAYYYKHENDLVFSIEFGPDFQIYTGDDQNGETEIILHYGAMAGFEGNKIAAHVEFLGNLALTDDHLITDSDEGYLHSLNFGASWNAGHLRPGLYYQIFLTDNMDNLIDGVLGISVGFVFGQDQQ